MKITDKDKVQKIVSKINGIIDLTSKEIIDITFRERKPMGTPEWFKTFEKKNDEQWKKNDERWEQQMDFNKNQMDFNKNQMKFNNVVSTFMKDQMDFNSKIMLRLDNIVSKNNLTE